MGPTGTGRLYESTLSREWARARIEEDETKKYRTARGLSSNNQASQKTFTRENVGGSTTGCLEETND